MTSVTVNACPHPSGVEALARRCSAAFCVLYGPQSHSYLRSIHRLNSQQDWWTLFLGLFLFTPYPIDQVQGTLSQMLCLGSLPLQSRGPLKRPSDGPTLQCDIAVVQPPGLCMPAIRGSALPQVCHLSWLPWVSNLHYFQPTRRWWPFLWCDIRVNVTCTAECNQ